MDFGQALEALRDGYKVSRQGWNGKGMFLYYVPANEYIPVTAIGDSLVNDSGKVAYVAYIAMKTVKGAVTPWQPSQEDMLSDDWGIL